MPDWCVVDALKAVSFAYASSVVGRNSVVLGGRRSAPPGEPRARWPSIAWPVARSAPEPLATRGHHDEEAAGLLAA